MTEDRVVSPSRRYVAICNAANFNEHYLRSFTLPETIEEWDLDEKSVHTLTNNAQVASWYFLNHLNAVACVEMIITEEAYLGMCPQKSVAEVLKS